MATIFLLSYRNGSTLLLRLLGDSNKTVKQKGEGAFTTTTKPPQLCKFYRHKEPIKPSYLYWYRLGNDNINFLPAGSRYVALIRDGRNQIASWLAHQKKFGGRKATVEEMCQGVINRWNIIKRSKSKIIKFEDLVTDPVGKTVRLFESIGLKPDIEAIQVADQLDPYKKQHLAHSSYTNQDFNTRWKQLPKRQQDLINHTITPTLKEQGYTV